MTKMPLDKVGVVIPLAKARIPLLSLEESFFAAGTGWSLDFWEKNPFFVGGKIQSAS
jgi:hypothetical protein